MPSASTISNSIADIEIVEKPRAISVGTLLVPVVLCVMLPSMSAARTSVVERPLVPDPVLVPAAAASAGLSASILAGSTYSEVAPPGVRLRVVEDEPYVYGLGEHCLEQIPMRGAFSTIELTSLLGTGGSYTAHVSLEWEPLKYKQQQVLRRFDLAAHNAYVGASLATESRAKSDYGIVEIRSPIGMASDQKGRCASREFIYYSAAIENPLKTIPSVDGTPYAVLQGLLMVVLEGPKERWLLSINFESSRFPHAVRLTENLARLVANRIYRGKSVPQLETLPYTPEYGLPSGDIALFPVDTRSADLVEQPGEDCAATDLMPGGYTGSCVPGATGLARPYNSPPICALGRAMATVEDGCEQSVECCGCPGSQTSGESSLSEQASSHSAASARDALPPDSGVAEPESDNFKARRLRRALTTDHLTAKEETKVEGWSDSSDVSLDNAVDGKVTAEGWAD